MFNSYISTQREWILGRGFNNTLTITFTLSGSAFDISGYTFSVPFRRIGGESNLLNLTQGSGVTNGGASGVLSIQVTQAQTESIDAGGYFYSINYLVSALPYSLFHGTASLLKDYNPNAIDNSVSVAVNLAGTAVTATVTLATNTDTRVRSTTSTATLTPNVSLYDMDVITAQAEALTIANPTGTPSNGNAYVLRVTPTGTHAISYGNKFRAIGSALTTAFTTGKDIYIPFVYNSLSDTYDCFPSQLEV
jgi:hypothetical protein